MRVSFDRVAFESVSNQHQIDLEKAKTEAIASSTVELNTKVQELENQIQKQQQVRIWLFIFANDSLVFANHLF